MMIETLKEQIKGRKVILFVGAGVSAALGLPTWSQLIDHIAKELDYDEKLYKLYGDSLSLAEYYVLKKGRIGELRSWMDRNWGIKIEDIKKSKIHELIVKLDFPIIYTTNYDHCLETAFSAWGKKYKRILDIADLVDLTPDATQIVKFHGDVISDESVVLTESSYFDRLDFESSLDIKLRSDMLGKSILFIGYSLSDINIRLLIYKLDKIWKKSNNYSQRPDSYIFLPVPNPIQEEILFQRGIKTIVGCNVDKVKSTEEFLETLYLDNAI